jgi:hypothetical protein
MLHIVDRVIARLVPQAVASAGCSQRSICIQCAGAHYARATQVCCLNEGCYISWIGTCGGC